MYYVKTTESEVPSLPAVAALIPPCDTDETVLTAAECAALPVQVNLVNNIKIVHNILIINTLII